MNGEVIGINAAKYADSQVEGMGYAIPISTAKPIIAELMNKQTRTPVEQNKRGYLGISGLNVDSQVQEMYGIPVGVYISRVYEGTAAQKAGLMSVDGGYQERILEVTLDGNQ